MINTASKLVLGIIGVLVILWWFRYDYIAVGHGIIFRIDRFTQTTSVAQADYNVWESIEESSPKLAEAPSVWDKFDEAEQATTPMENN